MSEGSYDEIVEDRPVLDLKAADPGKRSINAEANFDPDEAASDLDFDAIEKRDTDQEMDEEGPFIAADIEKRYIDMENELEDEREDPDFEEPEREKRQLLLPVLPTLKPRFTIPPVRVLPTLRPVYTPPTPPPYTINQPKRVSFDYSTNVDSIPFSRKFNPTDGGIFLWVHRLTKTTASGLS